MTGHVMKGSVSAEFIFYSLTPIKLDSVAINMIKDRFVLGINCLSCSPAKLNVSMYIPSWRMV